MTWLGILVMPTRGQGSNPTLSNLMKLMVAATLPALTAGEEIIKQVDPITRMGGYILLLMEIVSALMVLLLCEYLCDNQRFCAIRRVPEEDVGHSYRGNVSVAIYPQT